LEYYCNLQQLGISSSGFGKSAAPDYAFEKYAELRDRKSIRSDRKIQLELEVGADHTNVVYESLPAYTRLAKSRGVIVTAVHANPNKNIASEDEAVRQDGIDYSKKAVDVAKGLGADRVVIHPGYEFVDADNRKRFPDKGTFEKAAESIAEIAEYAMHSGIKLCLENLRHEGAIGSSPERLSKIVKLAREKCSSKSVRKLIGATLDLGHLNTTAKYGVSDYLSALDCGRDVYHAHLHYNNGKDDEHLPMIRVDPVWEAKLTALGNGLWSGRATSTMEINPLEESDVVGSIDTLYKNKYFKGHNCSST